MTVSEQLTQKDLDVVRYIKTYPGSTKEAVINGLQDRSSRVTVFNIIKNLEAQKIIDVQKDKPNSQTHHLYISKDDPVAQQLQELDEFENVFTPLLEAIKQEAVKYHFIMIKKLESYPELQDAKTKTSEEIAEIIAGSKFQKIVQPYFLRSTMFGMCLRIFVQLMQLCVIRSTFIWPFEIKDRKKLDQLIPIQFKRLIDIQQKMSQIISETSSLESTQAERIKLSGLPSRSDIILDVSKKSGRWLDLKGLKEYFKEFELEEAAQPVLEFVSVIMNEVQGHTVSHDEKLKD